MRMTKRLLATLGSTAAILAFGLGCSTDSPTAPSQDRTPPPGAGIPSASWIIEITISPSELTINDTQPATISVRVRRADNSQAPPSGTTLGLSTSLGSFESEGSGISSTAVSTVAGVGAARLFADGIAGTALISAQLEASVGQKTVTILDNVEAVQAAFAFSNVEGDLSVQFQNLSSGNPTEFLWDFGDGTTSTEEHPAHVFPRIGDFVVSLTASKQGSSNTTSQLVEVGEFVELEANFDFINSESNNSVKFLNTSTGDPTSFFWEFGDGTTSSLEHPDHIFPGAGDFVVTLTVRKGSDSDSIAKIVTVGQPLDLFLNFISPTTGSASGNTLVTINGTGFAQPLAVFFGSKFGEVISVKSTEITVRTPPGDMIVEDCDTDDNGTNDGTRTLDTPVSVTIELETGPTTSLPNAFTYLSPDGEICS